MRLPGFMKRRGQPWVVLWCAALVAAALAMPEPPRAGALALAAAVFAIFIAAGAAAREAMGLQTARDRLPLRLAVSAMSGALMGGVLLLALAALASFEPLLRTRYAARAADPMWRPWVLALESSIIEEIVFRLFIMTILAWLVVKAGRSRVSLPLAFGIALLVSSLVFGAAHVPAWASVAKPSIALVAAVLALNGLGGLLLGWVYWRWGILSAIVCHFAGDVVVQSVAPRLLA